MSDSGINWAICKSAPRSRQIAMPAPQQSVFYRLDALPAAKQQRQSTEGKKLYSVSFIKNKSACIAHSLQHIIFQVT